MDNQIYDTIIIGSGPAGLTAAIYNIRSALKTVVITGNQPGGQLTITTTVDNWPGFPNGTGGIKLMMDMQTQVKNLGGEIRNGVVRSIKPFPNPSALRVSDDLDRTGSFAVELNNGETLITRAVIVATGAGARWLSIPKEKELIGRGISGCATCDGMFFRDKTVAIVGGGDVACEEAEFLTKFATKVYLIHRRDTLKAQVPQQKLVLNNPKIELVWNTEVVEINPSDPNPSRPAAASLFDERETNNEKLENIKIKNIQTGEEKIMPIDGLFVAIGRIPMTDFVKDLVELKEGGQIKTGVSTEYETMSTMEGVFAAGDCVDEIYRQGVIAAGDGAKAGLDAERWLKDN